MRDQETGYYSAAVLDFDDNSIEVTYREKNSELVRSRSDDSRVSNWQKDVAKSAAGRASQAATGPAGITVNNITNPTMVISHPLPEPKPRNEMSSRAIIGTLLGAAAGAVVAYAMTKAEDEDLKAAEPRKISYQAIEAPKLEIVQSVKDSSQARSQCSVSHSPQTVLQQIGYLDPSASVTGRSTKSRHANSSVPTLGPRTVTTPVAPRSILADNLVASSEAGRHPAGSLIRSHTDSQLQLHGSRAVSSISQHPQKPEPSAKSSVSKTIIPADFKSAKGSVVTEVRVARDLPLPHSRATSVLGNGQEKFHGSVAGSVTPSDSVSQAGSKKSRASGRSKRYSSSKLREGKAQEDGDSGVSERRTVSNESPMAGEKRVSVASLPMRPSSKASVHRTVMSFLGA